MATQYPIDNRHEYYRLLEKVIELEEKNRQLNIDLRKELKKRIVVKRKKRY